MNIQELDAQWRKGGLSFKEIDGHPVAVVRNAASEASISLYGGHVMTWKPQGKDNVLWLSPAAKIEDGKSIRGGVPVCWPWFGACPFNTEYPLHGFVRLAAWRIESLKEPSADLTEITLAFDSDSIPKPFKFQAFNLRLRVTVGHALTIALEMENSGSEELQFSAGLHTYLNVGDIGKVSIEGLDGVSYFSKSEGVESKQSGILKFAGKVDRIYRKASSAKVIDAALGRTLLVENENASSMVVWNPGEGVERQFPGFAAGDDRKFVCVEAAQPEKLSIKSKAAASIRTKISVA